MKIRITYLQCECERCKAALGNIYDVIDKQGSLIGPRYTIMLDELTPLYVGDYNCKEVNENDLETFMPNM